VATACSERVLRRDGYHVLRADVNRRCQHGLRASDLEWRKGFDSEPRGAATVLTKRIALGRGLSQGKGSHRESASSAKSGGAFSRERCMMVTRTQRLDAEIRLAGACRDAEGA
jgi:hypothetical protein